MADEIIEYHCCSDCRKKIQIPTKNMQSWELGCTDKRGQPNSSGGLTRCTVFEEE